MAVKGNAYTKTTWAFEERPVASSKLNLWDDRVETALELIHFLLLQTYGGGEGVLRGASQDDLFVKATAPAGLSVEVQPGYALISDFPYKLASATETVPIAAPIANPRKDLVQARLATWDISVKQGAEAASPNAPAPDPDALPLAELFLRPGMANIQDTDDTVNGYIIDVRPFL